MRPGGAPLRQAGGRTAAAPEAWTVALRYGGNGREIDGPGNIAFDADGDAWASNNYRHDADPAVPACGGESVLKFTPTGRDAPGAPYRGGGLYGAGFGVTVDARGSAWVSNSGILPVPCGDGTAGDLADAAVAGDAGARPGASVPLIRSDGTPAPEPFTGGGLFLPWGVAVDGDDTVWVANFGGPDRPPAAPAAPATAAMPAVPGAVGATTHRYRWAARAAGKTAPIGAPPCRRPGSLPCRRPPVPPPRRPPRRRPGARRCAAWASGARATR
ncbi:hypothetical protein ACIQOV_31695 [Kitasatospora sp. NPDC091257]|uniref:hypothetical protein n=1 Tax=Kitasatospora sp. NPDC091257 TaxID=3364084 RepID=UPI00380810C3